MVNRQMPLSAAAVASLVLFVAAFVVALPAPRVDAASPPMLIILSPANNSAVGNGSPLLISFIVFNFNFTQPGTNGQTNAPNEGHVHVLIDGAYSQLVANVETVRVTGLSGGSHTIALQLVNNDHTPISPVVSASITVTASSSTGTVSAAGLTTGELGAVGLGALNFILLIVVLAMLRGRKKETP